jgi:hypothetical protein
MDNMRLGSAGSVPPGVPCCLCGALGRGWDRLAGKPYCPNCQEAMVQGETPPLIERAEKRRCTVCNTEGTLAFLTFPLNSPRPLEMDLCPEHLRALLARRLGMHAFIQLRRQLEAFELKVGDVFLLHEAFYDRNGRALQPAVEPL